MWMASGEYESRRGGFYDDDEDDESCNDDCEDSSYSESEYSVYEDYGEYDDDEMTDEEEEVYDAYGNADDEGEGEGEAFRGSTMQCIDEEHSVDENEVSRSALHVKADDNESNFGSTAAHNGDKSDKRSIFSRSSEASHAHPSHAHPSHPSRASMDSSVLAEHFLTKMSRQQDLNQLLRPHSRPEHNVLHGAVLVRRRRKHGRHRAITASSYRWRHIVLRLDTGWLFTYHCPPDTNENNRHVTDLLLKDRRYSPDRVHVVPDGYQSYRSVCMMLPKDAWVFRDDLKSEKVFVVQYDLRRSRRQLNACRNNNHNLTTQDYSDDSDNEPPPPPPPPQQSPQNHTFTASPKISSTASIFSSSPSSSSTSGPGSPLSTTAASMTSSFKRQRRKRQTSFALSAVGKLYIKCPGGGNEKAMWAKAAEKVGCGGPPARTKTFLGASVGNAKDGFVDAIPKDATEGPRVCTTRTPTSSMIGPLYCAGGRSGAIASPKQGSCTLPITTTTNNNDTNRTHPTMPLSSKPTTNTKTKHKKTNVMQQFSSKKNNWRYRTDFALVSAQKMSIMIRDPSLGWGAADPNAHSTLPVAMMRDDTSARVGGGGLGLPSLHGDGIGNVPLRGRSARAAHDALRAIMLMDKNTRGKTLHTDDTATTTATLQAQQKKVTLALDANQPLEESVSSHETAPSSSSNKTPLPSTTTTTTTHTSNITTATTTNSSLRRRKRNQDNQENHQNDSYLPTTHPPPGANRGSMAFPSKASMWIRYNSGLRGSVVNQSHTTTTTTTTSMLHSTAGSTGPTSTSLMTNALPKLAIAKTLAHAAKQKVVSSTLPLPSTGTTVTGLAKAAVHKIPLTRPSPTPQHHPSPRAAIMDNPNKSNKDGIRTFGGTTEKPQSSSQSTLPKRPKLLANKSEPKENSFPHIHSAATSAVGSLSTTMHGAAANSTTTQQHMPTPRVKEHRVYPTYAYPNQWMTKKELEVEMLRSSAKFHDLREDDVDLLPPLSNTDVPINQPASAETLPSASSLASNNNSTSTPAATRKQTPYSAPAPYIGSINVEVLSCIGLPRFSRFFDDMDTVVYLVCADRAFCTDIIPYGNSSPLWPCKSRRAVIFPLRHAYAKLYAGVFSAAGDNFAGRVLVDIATLRPNTVYDVTLPLRETAQMYHRRPRGVIRLRFRVKWENERAAVMSYLPSPFYKTPPHLSRPVTIPCVDRVAFRCVALTVHGSDMNGKFNRTIMRAISREIKLYKIKMKQVLRETLHDLSTWDNPAVSSYVFWGWMHCTYRGSVALAFPYGVGLVVLFHLRNYAAYVYASSSHMGYAPLTIRELFFSLIYGGPETLENYEGIDHENGGLGLFEWIVKTVLLKSNQVGKDGEQQKQDNGKEKNNRNHPRSNLKRPSSQRRSRRRGATGANKQMKSIDVKRLRTTHSHNNNGSMHHGAGSTSGNPQTVSQQQQPLPPQKPIMTIRDLSLRNSARHRAHTAITTLFQYLGFLHEDQTKLSSSTAKPTAQSELHQQNSRLGLHSRQYLDHHQSHHIEFPFSDETYSKMTLRESTADPNSRVAHFDYDGDSSDSSELEDGLEDLARKREKGWKSGKKLTKFVSAKLSKQNTSDRKKSNSGKDNSNSQHGGSGYAGAETSPLRGVGENNDGELSEVQPTISVSDSVSTGPVQPKVPVQDIDIVLKSSSIIDQLAHMRLMAHKATFGLINYQVFRVTKKSQDPRLKSSRSHDDDDSESDASQNLKKPSTAKDTEEDPSSVQAMEKTLGIGQSLNPMMAVGFRYASPLSQIMRIFLAMFRSGFNIFMWKDPFGSFWFLMFCIILIMILIVFPWRLFTLLSGIAFVGPQNWIIRKRREQRLFWEKYGANQAQNGSFSDQVGTSQNDEKQSENGITDGGASGKNSGDVGGTTASTLSSHLGGKKATQFTSSNSAPVRFQEVVVPYSPLRQERFYDWPPLPTLSSAHSVYDMMGSAYGQQETQE